MLNSQPRQGADPEREGLRCGEGELHGEHGHGAGGEREGQRNSEKELLHDGPPERRSVRSIANGSQQRDQRFKSDGKIERRLHAPKIPKGNQRAGVGAGIAVPWRPLTEEHLSLPTPRLGSGSWRSAAQHPVAGAAAALALQRRLFDDFATADASAAGSLAHRRFAACAALL
jgi:hypothetical protein